MNATSLVRPCLWLLAAPVLFFGLWLATPADTDGAETKSNTSRLAPRDQAAAKKNFRHEKDKKKHAKKHHKHHKKHHKKSVKKDHKKHSPKAGKKGEKKGERKASENKKQEVAAMEKRVGQDHARLERDEQALARDNSRLRRVLK